MELQRAHLFKCVQCGHVNEHTCDQMGQAPNEVHYYHHDDTNKAPHSVEVSRNAKGEYSYSIKAYGKTVEEARALVYAQLASLDALLADLRRGGKDE